MNNKTIEKKIFFSNRKGGRSHPSPPYGSATVLARDNERQTRSLIWACRDERPALDRQDRPWVPRESTSEPQGQMWGSHMSAPSLNPTATLTVSSSSLSPQTEIGSACNQSPRYIYMWGSDGVKSGHVAFITAAIIQDLNCMVYGSLVPWTLPVDGILIWFVGLIASLPNWYCLCDCDVRSQVACMENLWLE